MFQWREVMVKEVALAGWIISNLAIKVVNSEKKNYTSHKI